MQLQESLQQLFQVDFMIFNLIILISILIAVIILIKINEEYKHGAYYQITKLPYLSVRLDLGKYGEFLTYKHLKNFESGGSKFLFNIYLPKENGETTEIDVLMISPKGIFVFESKNYSGWIFGNETQKNWYQTLSKGRGHSHKEHFYNPIMQNRSHIKYLQAFLGEQIPMKSIIVFSDRCTLKNIQICNNDIMVINRYDVSSVVSKICNQIPNVLLTESDISKIYDRLYPYTQVNENIKIQHTENIRNNSVSKPVQEVTIASAPTPHLYHSEAGSEQADSATDSIDAASINEKVSETATNSVKQNELKCPICNGKLVVRTATRGANIGNQFYGCSNYPKCRYTRNL